MPRRIRRILPTWPVWTLLLLAALLVLRSGDDEGAASRELPPSGVSLGVERSIDGDTLLLESGHRIRLIGIDTPETKHPNRPAEPWGLEAAEFTRNRTDRHMVTLEYDRERLDAYHRILAFVYVDGELLNEELIRAGLSRAVTTFPFRSDLQRRFRNAEREAQQAGRGMWSADTKTQN